METVALRGTLIPPENSGSGTTGENSNGSTSHASSASWQWKGMWAFGSSLSTAAAQSQQPFLYTFQKATHPSEVAIPGIPIEDKEAEGDGGDRAKEDDDDEKPAEETKGEEEESTAASSTANETTSEANQPLKEESQGADEMRGESNNGVDESADVQDKDENKIRVEAADTTMKDPSVSSTKPTDEKSEPQEIVSTKADDTPVKADSKKPTFATVPEGHPAFTDACEKYPDKACPVSGQWQGYFQNLTGTRPRDKQTQKVQETFYLFFNATPGPDVKYVFDDTPLPPTVHKESLVLVRGMGTNAFGTFQLVGYLDLTAHVLEIQRQYVLVPTTPRTRRANGGSRRGSSSTINTRHKKSYFTRKRQPSWKLKSRDEQEREENTPKRQKLGQGGRRSPKAIGEAVGFPAPGMTTSVGGTGASTAGSVRSTALDLTGSAEPPVSISGIMPPPGTIIPPSSTFGLSASPSPMFPKISNSPPGAAPLPSGTPLPVMARPVAGGVKKGKSSRKRTTSAGSAKSIASSTTSSTVGGLSANPNSPFFKLPPVGEPKKARWRAAHFLYYQRHEPDEVFPEISNGPGGTVNSNKSGTPSSTSGTPNPRYVVYEGEMVNCQREGRGICLYSNNMLYEGEWKRNKEHGHGQLWTADRRRMIYDGEWERGRMQGHGTYYYGNGNGNGNGNGIKSSTPNLHPSGGSRYIGEFKENMRNGMGQYILPDGSVYDGMWSQGKMNGRGVFTWPDYSVYDGEWKDGERHGQGLLKTSDGFVYDGMWVRNAMEGRGTATYPNGQTYEGMFVNGRREGRGTMQFTNGAVYEGRFRDDAVDGQGTMKMSRAMVVLNDKNSINDDETETSNAGEPSSQDEQAPSNENKPDFMIPIYFQSDMTHIHAKAGFTAIGD